MDPDEALSACDNQALYALHCLSDALVYTLPEALQSAEIRRRIIMRARECKDEAVLRDVVRMLAEAMGKRR